VTAEGVFSELMGSEVIDKEPRTQKKGRKKDEDQEGEREVEFGSEY
jgi:hypothetical protein